MVDLLQSQIKESCNLALPDGLKELMSDISREVLRAQPNDIYKFIADYLSALLVTRENMSVVTRICDDTCAETCLPELEDQLRYLGLNEEDTATATKMILEYFDKSGDKINEGNLIMKLMKETNLDINLLPQVQSAVRVAFQTHQINNNVVYESSSGSEKDEIDCAASHTLQLYRKSKPTEDDLNQKAAKIQAAYRAYGVRRNCENKETKPKTDVPKAPEIRKNITFDQSATPDEPRTSVSDYRRSSVVTVSSVSLAGSYVHLPRHKPYCAHEIDHSLLEVEEKDRESSLDYSLEILHRVTNLSQERRLTSEE